MNKNVHHYGTSIEEGKFIITAFYSDNLEEMGEDVLILSHYSQVNIDRCYEETFDDEEGLMNFIAEKKRQEQRNMYYYFISVAYEIIDEHFIKLYYNTHVSYA